jgi:hypothetical protein
VFISGNIFNSLVSNKKTKKIHNISLYFEYSFTDFILLNSFLQKKYIKQNFRVFLFMFFFDKTKTSIRFLDFKQTSKQTTTNIIKNIFIAKTQPTVVLIKYIKLFIVNKYTNFFIFNSSVNNINVVSSSIKNIKLNSSSIYKNISIFDFVTTEFQFLRKNKVYNKGRYSRCRQNYRTGVYLCMYLSVVSIFGLYYWFFKFSFNFSYL